MKDNTLVVFTLFLIICLFTFESVMQAKAHFNMHDEVINACTMPEKP